MSECSDVQKYFIINYTDSWNDESYAKSCQMCSQHVGIYMGVLRNEASVKDANERHGIYLEVWTNTLIKQPCTLGVSVSVRPVMLSISQSGVLFVVRQCIFGTIPKSEVCPNFVRETVQHYTETRGQDSQFPYQLTEGMDITDTENFDPYITTKCRLVNRG